MQIYNPYPVIRVKRKEITGPKKSDKKKTNIKKKTREYCSMILITFAKEAGNRAKSILDPSSGGTGMRLNIPKARLTITILESIKPNPSSG